MSEQRAVVELTLSGAQNLDDLAAFGDVLRRMGVPLSSPVEARFNTVTVRTYLRSIRPIERRRDPETGRFMRVVS
jgi:hypothetical protein